ncbi:MAG: MATE family efflux transporter [Catenulispora sp.]|nr:MATE family efflux transporter [Catenulispora sp.]
MGSGSTRHHRRAIAALAWPVYVELLAGVIAGIIDVAWVARLGAAATAAVALATNLENLVLGLILVSCAGTTVLIAGRSTEAGRRAALRGGVVLAGATTLAVVGVGLAVRGPVVGLFFGEGEARRAALGFLAISIPGLAVSFAQLMVDSVFKGLGDTRTPMRLAMGANALILVLDPTLIYGLGLGVRGAAIATVSGRALMLAVGLAMVRNRSLGGDSGCDEGGDGDGSVVEEAAASGAIGGTAAGRSPVGTAVLVKAARRAQGQAAGQAARRTARPSLRTALAEALDVARAGAPLGADFVVRMAGATALAAVVATFGVAAVAAYGIGTKAMYFASMAFYAVRQAATIHTARSAPGQSAVIGRATVVVGVSIGGVAALVYAGAAPWIMAAFTGRPEVAAVGVEYLRWLALYLVPISAVISLSGVMAAGRGRNRLLLVTVGGTGALVVLAHALAGPFGLAGVWAAMCGSAALQCAALLVLLRRISARTRP